MDEVGTALIAMTLVVCAVFIPTVFLSGILGQFFRQFAVTIATATLISLVVSLTLSPALCALLFKPHGEHKKKSLIGRGLDGACGWFNTGFDWVSTRYGTLTGRLLRVSGIMLAIYAGLVGLTVYQFRAAPTGFIPNQDLGYLINIIQLPPGASLSRTNDVALKVTKIALETPGVAHAVPIVGLDGATFRRRQRGGRVHAARFLNERAKNGLTAEAISGALNQGFASVKDAFVLSISPPPVRGIGTTGGFKMQVQDTKGSPLRSSRPSPRSSSQRQTRIRSVAGIHDIQYPRPASTRISTGCAPKCGVNADDIFQTLEVYLGSQYVNDFNFPADLQSDGAGRRGIPSGSARHLATQGTKRRWRDGAARLRGLVPRHHRRLPGPALQPLPRRRCARRNDARLFERLRLGGHGAAGERGSARGLFVPMDGAGFPGGRPGTRRSSSLPRRWCSCSFCSPRSTRAGVCRSPSSSSCPCVCSRLSAGSCCEEWM